jgi:hypothetical protein
MPVKNKIADLRDYLFEGMERLLDDKDKFSAAEGIALAQLGKVIVDSAKAEIQVAKMKGEKSFPSDFIEETEPKLKQLNPKGIDKLG